MTIELINLSATTGSPERIVFEGGALRLSPTDDGTRETYDARGALPFCGLIDLQCNGGLGHDFTTDPTSIWAVAKSLPRFGVTAFLPTIITSPVAQIETAITAFKAGAPAGFQGATPLGLHLEGPFLNPSKAGAHNPAHLRIPTESDIDLLTVENGVLMVTLAPEVEGCLDLIKILDDRGILVCVGHSNATAEQALEAFDAGARYATHLFNASSPLHHRDPGVPGVALAHEGVTVGVIADGVHLHDNTVRLIHASASSPNRVSIVTDAMAAMGLEPGTYSLAEQQVIVDSTSARLKDGTLAGSILTLDQACRNYASQTSCSLEEAVDGATTVAAGALRMQRGLWVEGAPADVVLMEETGHVKATFVSGVCVFDSSRQ